MYMSGVLHVVLCNLDFLRPQYSQTGVLNVCPNTRFSHMATFSLKIGVPTSKVCIMDIWGCCQKFMRSYNRNLVNKLETAFTFAAHRYGRLTRVTAGLLVYDRNVRLLNGVLCADV